MNLGVISEQCKAAGKPGAFWYILRSPLFLLDLLGDPFLLGPIMEAPLKARE